jgi:hypothetical protein
MQMIEVISATIQPMPPPIIPIEIRQARIVSNMKLHKRWQGCRYQKWAQAQFLTLSFNLFDPARRELRQQPSRNI